MNTDRDAHFEPGKLWSLWDLMQKVGLDDFWEIAAEWHDSLVSIWFKSAESEELTAEEKANLSDRLTRLRDLCHQVGLDSSGTLIGHALNNLPKSSGEMNLIWLAVKSEMESHLFLSVPSERKMFYNMNAPMSVRGMERFPKAAQELRNAGNAFVADLPTASVYHCMRALEYGLRAMAADVLVEVEAESWHTIIERIETKIDKARDAPRGEGKSARLQFLSEAAAEFRYFKDGWRNYASHVKISYDDAQAVRVMQHVATFISHLSAELKEAP